MNEPANVFFDMITACEGVACDVLKNGFTYYDIYTPEVLQSFYVPRVQEYVFNVSPQFSRCRECWAPHLCKSYGPETDLALPRLIAYLKIHGLNIAAEARCRHGTKCSSSRQMESECHDAYCRPWPTNHVCSRRTTEKGLK